MTQTEIQNAIGQAIYPDMIEKLLKLAADIGKTLADFIAHVKDILAEDSKPRTIPPRSPVRCIGCRPETRNRKPTVIRRGCRHK